MNTCEIYLRSVQVNRKYQKQDKQVGQDKQDEQDE